MDIVTDTLHASSSDLITWSTLVMISSTGLIAFLENGVRSPLTHLKSARQGMRRHLSYLIIGGYARVTPAALSKDGVPGQAMYPVDHYPVEGLRIYEDFELCSHFSGYVVRLDRQNCSANACG